MIIYVVLTTIVLSAGKKYMRLQSETQIARLKKIRQQEELLLFDFRKIATATNNFDEANKVGEGGFGPIYKVLFKLGGLSSLKS